MTEHIVVGHAGARVARNEHVFVRATLRLPCHDPAHIPADSGVDTFGKDNAFIRDACIRKSFVWALAGSKSKDQTFDASSSGGGEALAVAFPICDRIFSRAGAC